MTTIIIIIVIVVIAYFCFSSKGSATNSSVDFSESINYFLNIIEDFSHFLSGLERHVLFCYDYSNNRIAADIMVRDADYYVDQYSQYYMPGARFYIGEDRVYKNLFGDYRPHYDDLINALGSDGKKDGNYLRMVTVQGGKKVLSWHNFWRHANSAFQTTQMENAETHHSGYFLSRI